MREIKFRAWNIEKKKMVSWGEMVRNKEWLQSIMGNEFYATTPPRYLWERMQFTGLHDKNGKEIYEGDIVEVNDCKYTIIFRGMGFWFVDSDDDGWVYDPNVYLITVLGNIYENSDLLNND